jgi:hypothetical protein
MYKESLLDKFEDRVGRVVDDTHGIGWGFHDYLVQVWIDFYPTADDDEFEDESAEQQEKGKVLGTREQ